MASSILSALRSMLYKMVLKETCFSFTLFSLVPWRTP